MLLRHFIILFFLSVPVFSFAQVDSFETRELLLKEVIIQQGGTRSNSKLFSPAKNLLTSTDEVLNSMSGVSMIKRGNYAWEPGIRGLNNGQIRTTIDGMAIFGACTDRMDPVSSYVEPSNLKSIIINYGNNEVASGNTIGGGFDFKIQQPVFSNKKSFSGMVISGYESNGNSNKILTSLNYSEKRLGINVNGIYRTSDSYVAGGNERIPYSQYTKWNGGIGVKYKIDPHNNLLVNYIRDEGYNIGYPALTMDVMFAKANILSLTHHLHIGEGIFTGIENKIYFNSINHAMDDTKRPSSEIFMHMDMPGTSKTSGLASVISGGIGKHSFKTKLQIYQNLLHAEMTMYPDNGSPMFMLTLPDPGRNYYEISGHDNWEITAKLSLQSGLTAALSQSDISSEEGKQTVSGTLRGKFDRSDILYSFYLNPVYQLHKHMSVFINSGYTMRSPTLQELFGFYLFNRPDGFDYLGNPLLENETSFNFTLGADFKNEKVKFSVKAFSYFMQNYITGVVTPGFDKMTEGANGVKQYQNIGSAVLYGFESDVEWKMNKQFGFTSNNSFSYGRDILNNALPFIPPFRSTNKVDFGWRDYGFHPEVVISAAQNHVSGSMYGESSTPSSFVLNFVADRIFEIGGNTFCINAGVSNILDARYYDHNDVMKVLRPGRSASVQFSWYF